MTFTNTACSASCRVDPSGYRRLHWALIPEPESVRVIVRTSMPARLMSGLRGPTYRVTLAGNADASIGSNSVGRAS